MMQKLPISKILMGLMVVPSLVLAESPVGKVTYILGDVDLKKVNQENWKPLKNDKRVFESDRVRTGPESAVRFKLVDRYASEITVAENAEVLIAELKEITDAFHAKLDIKKGHVNFKVDKLSKNSTVEFKTGTATAAIRGTEGFIGGENGFYAGLKSGKLEITSAKNGRTFFVNKGETAFGRDSIVVMKLASSGDLRLAKRLQRFVEDPAVSLDQLVEEAKKADSDVQKMIQESSSEVASSGESLTLSEVSASVCQGGLTIKGAYSTKNTAATLVVKIGRYVSENLLSTANGNSTQFSTTIPVTDRNGLWTEKSGEVVLSSGGQVYSEKFQFNVDKTCGDVNTMPASVKFTGYDSLRCIANISVSGVNNDAVVFAVLKDGAAYNQDAITRDALKRVKLSEGLHEYSFEVTDMANNKLSQKKTLGCYPPKKFNVQIVGAKREVLNVPPAPYGVDDKIIKNMQFTIRVPGGDYQVLYKVVVKMNGRVILHETMNQIQSLDYQIPLDLKRNVQNKVDVEVTHKSGYIVKTQKVYEVH